MKQPPMPGQLTFVQRTPEELKAMGCIKAFDGELAVKFNSMWMAGSELFRCTDGSIWGRKRK